MLHYNLLKVLQVDYHILDEEPKKQQLLKERTRL